MSTETPENTSGAEENEQASSSQGEKKPQEFVSKAEFDAGLKKIEELIQGSTERTKQSQRDAIKDRVESVEERLLKRLTPVLAKAGVDLEQERRAEGLNILAEKFLQDPTADAVLPKATQSSSPASEPAGSAENILIDNLLKEGGLSRDHPEISKYLANLPAGRTLGGVARELGDLVDEIGQRKEPSGNIGLPAGSPEAQASLDKLVAGYREDALAVRGKGMNALRQVREKWRKAGLANPEDVPIQEFVPYSERDPKQRRLA